MKRMLPSMRLRLPLSCASRTAFSIGVSAAAVVEAGVVAVVSVVGVAVVGGGDGGDRSES